jgi:hypothetical protein
MIFRRASYPQETFTTIPNALLRGKNKASERRSDLLSAESVGVLVYLLSHRADWKVTNKQLSGESWIPEATHHSQPRRSASRMGLGSL